MPVDRKTGAKICCESCILGHRVAQCTHQGRWMYAVQPPGRPPKCKICGGTDCSCKGPRQRYWVIDVRHNPDVDKEGVIGCDVIAKEDDVPPAAETSAGQSSCCHKPASKVAAAAAAASEPAIPQAPLTPAASSTSSSQQSTPPEHQPMTAPVSSYGMSHTGWMPQHTSLQQHHFDFSHHLHQDASYRAFLPSGQQNHMSFMVAAEPQQSSYPSHYGHPQSGILQGYVCSPNPATQPCLPVLSLDSCSGGPHTPHFPATAQQKIEPNDNCCSPKKCACPANQCNCYDCADHVFTPQRFNTILETTRHALTQLNEFGGAGLGFEMPGEQDFYDGTNTEASDLYAPGYMSHY